ncbi:MAG TPA: bifunctional 2-C-methyl-D-erythritol 4-phosphate cytidylyltransferase/2-C-methyl-D-erythritol 2,4-cyclodiphosphate synthase [Campylobacterales bacterium]|nr:bifunctional 2-C-methyl-D-erythritol 4-phosphate cytidylyltransferase/2-C-methyl-D-erythritol 2,4-cyclodiphosphate synthase [Campylobacterales bacterium]HHS93494.1 bifunctional 2-C-methyl-D-erythritol 4-phosphate cytidylyltransferase/2-C-methyl-D-erythritol 2,4-cyclodiphosphate synthase [Campylobacterales bacterium]
MSDITLILLGAGSASRFKLPPKKQWLWMGNQPLWLKVVNDFQKIDTFHETIIVSSKEDIQSMSNFGDYHFVEGGSSRQQSLNNALKVVNTPYVLVSDIARCCLDEAMIKRVISAKKNKSCVVPTLKVVDTLYHEMSPIDRESTKIIQTPQLSCTQTLKEALSTEKEFSDDSSAVSSMGGEVIFVEGSVKAHKLTTVEDLSKMSCLEAPSNRALTGFGVDIHPFEEGKQMVLCGVEIDSTFGFKAHSDGDVAIHALIDALLGAAGLGDIGEFYPDTSEEFKGADSTILLLDTVKRLNDLGYVIGNVDLSIIAQTPRLLNYKKAMRFNLANLLNLQANLVNIKATTSERLGWIGRKEGIAVEAVATLYYYDWTNNENYYN